MATDLVQGLFGPSPWDIQQAQQNALYKASAEHANRTLAQKASQGMFEAGGKLAGAIAPAFGYVNPMQEEAKLRQSVMGAGGDLTTSQGLKAKAAEFAQAGDQQTAMKLLMLARKQEQEEQKMALEARKQALGEKKQDFMETEAFELKKREAEARIAQNQQRIDDARTSAEERAALMRENNEIKRMLIEQKAAQSSVSPPKNLTREARLKWELDNGLIDEETYKEAMAATPGGKAKLDSEKQVKSAKEFLAEAGYDAQSDTDEISKLIKKSTSGKAEAVGAEVASWLDISTEGRKAINTLASKANRITMALMGGRLGAGISNTDREFVLGQLGDVANAQKTSGERLAAWQSALGRMKQIAGVSKETKPSSIPAGIPVGSVLIGKSPEGKDVYQSPDGKKWTTK